MSYQYPVIAGHNTASNPFPEGFSYVSTPPKPSMDAKVEIVVANVAKCFAASRPDVAYALIYTYQPLGGTSHAALVKALHTPGPWTPADGTALQQFDGHWSGFTIADFPALAKSLKLENV